MAESGLTTIQSRYDARVTADRLEAAAKAKGLTIFARIDHGAGAEAAGLPLRPTIPVIFGNARGGTPLMQAAQAAGIDLPLKALAWEDATGKTWLSWNEPSWLAARHGVGEAVGGVVKNLATVSRSLAQEATGSS